MVATQKKIFRAISFRLTKNNSQNLITFLSKISMRQRRLFNCFIYLNSKLSRIFNYMKRMLLKINKKQTNSYQKMICPSIKCNRSSQYLYNHSLRQKLKIIFAMVSLKYSWINKIVKLRPLQIFLLTCHIIYFYQN